MATKGEQLTSQQFELIKKINAALLETNTLIGLQVVQFTQLREAARRGISSPAQLAALRAGYKKQFDDIIEETGNQVKKLRGDFAGLDGSGGLDSGSVRNYNGLLGQTATSLGGINNQMKGIARESDIVYGSTKRTFGGTADNADFANNNAKYYQETLRGINTELAFTGEQNKINNAYLAEFAGTGGLGVKNVSKAYRELASTSTLAYALTAQGMDDFSREAGRTKEQVIKDRVDMSAQMYALQVSDNMSVGQFRALLERELSLTGKVTGKFTADLINYSEDVEATTGVSAKAIRKVMTQVMADTEKFGNVMPKQAATIASTLHAMRIDFRDLQSIVGNTNSYEKAAAATTSMAAVFRTAINPVKLMNLMNTDQAKGLMYMREKLLAAGWTREKLAKDLPRQRKLMKQLGASSTDVGLRLLDTSVKIEDVWDKSGKAVTKGVGDQSKAISRLTDDIDVLNKQKGAAPGEALKGMAVVDLGKQATGAGTAIRTLQGSIKTKALDAAARSVTALAGGTMDLSKVDPKALIQIGKALEASVAFSTTGDPAKLQSFVDALAGLNELENGSKAVQEIAKSMGSINKEIAQFPKTLASSVTSEGEVTAFFKPFVDGMTIFTEEYGKQLEKLPVLIKLADEDAAKAFAEGLNAPKSVPRALQPWIQGAQYFGEEYSDTLDTSMSSALAAANALAEEGMANQTDLVQQSSSDLSKMQLNEANQAVSRFGSLGKDLSSKLQEQMATGLGVTESELVQSMENISAAVDDASSPVSPLLPPGGKVEIAQGSAAPGVNQLVSEMGRLTTSLGSMPRDQAQTKILETMTKLAASMSDAASKLEGAGNINLTLEGDLGNLIDNIAEHGKTSPRGYAINVERPTFKT